VLINTEIQCYMATNLATKITKHSKLEIKLGQFSEHSFYRLHSVSFFFNFMHIRFHSFRFQVKPQSKIQHTGIH